MSPITCLPPYQKLQRKVVTIPLPYLLNNLCFRPRSVHRSIFTTLVLDARASVKFTPILTASLDDTLDKSDFVEQPTISWCNACGSNGNRHPRLRKKWRFYLFFLANQTTPLNYVSANDLPSGQSSPGTLQSEQHPSKGARQIPHLSSFASHFQTATVFQPSQNRSRIIHKS